MKKTIAVVALAMIAFTVRATELIPYLAVPVGIGYAVDAKGVRRPNGVCLRDAVFAPPLRYPYELQSRTYGDSAAWARYKGNGLYRVEIDMNTGHVNQVVTIQSPDLFREGTVGFIDWLDVSLNKLINLVGHQLSQLHNVELL